MKKVLLISGIALALIATSCAKKCNCTYFEDNKKVFVATDNEVKYFEKSVCEENSVKPYQGLSKVTEGKEVTKEIKCK